MDACWEVGAVCVLPLLEPVRLCLARGMPLPLLCELQLPFALPVPFLCCLLSPYKLPPSTHSHRHTRRPPPCRFHTVRCPLMEDAEDEEDARSQASHVRVVT